MTDTNSIQRTSDKTMRALWEYTAVKDDELSFPEGTIITVLSEESPGWWLGQIGEAVGFFPLNYTEDISAGGADEDLYSATQDSREFDDEFDDEEEIYEEILIDPAASEAYRSAIKETLAMTKDVAPATKSTFAGASVPAAAAPETPPPSASPSAQITIVAVQMPGQSAKEEERWYDGAPGGADIRNALSKRECNRQEAIFECLTSERGYARDLHVILDQFLKPLRDSDVVNKTDLNILFSNIEQLLPLAEELASCLDERRKQSVVVDHVGDVYLLMADFFRMYTLYCGNFEHALVHIDKLRKNKKASALLDKLERSPECRMLNLNSFLIKPVQRICKYPLLIKAIIKHTEENHKDFQFLTQALNKLETIVTIVNEGNKAAERTNRMIEIQGKLKNDDFALITPSRKLLREDEVKDVTGKKEDRIAFLFNDVVLLTTKNGKFHAAIPFDSCIVNDSPEAAASAAPDVAARMFEIIHLGKTKFTLVAASADVRQTWIDELVEMTKDFISRQQEIWLAQGISTALAAAPIESSDDGPDAPEEDEKSSSDADKEEKRKEKEREKENKKKDKEAKKEKERLEKEEKKDKERKEKEEKKEIKEKEKEKEREREKEEQAKRASIAAATTSESPTSSTRNSFSGTPPASAGGASRPISVAEHAVNRGRAGSTSSNSSSPAALRKPSSPLAQGNDRPASTISNDNSPSTTRRMTSTIDSSYKRPGTTIQPKAAPGVSSMMSAYTRQAQKDQQHFPVRVLSYDAEGNDQYSYNLTVKLTETAQSNTIKRTYADFYDLHVRMIQSFPDEAGSRAPYKRTLPDLPQQRVFVNESIAGIRQRELDTYCKKLWAMSDKITKSDLVQKFLDDARRSNKVGFKKSGQTATGTSNSVSTPGVNTANAAAVDARAQNYRDRTASRITKLVGRAKKNLNAVDPSIKKTQQQQPANKSGGSNNSSATSVRNSTASTAPASTRASHIPARIKPSERPELAPRPEFNRVELRKTTYGDAVRTGRGESVKPTVTGQVVSTNKIIAAADAKKAGASPSGKPDEPVPEFLQVKLNRTNTGKEIKSGGSSSTAAASTSGSSSSNGNGNGAAPKSGKKKKGFLAKLFGMFKSKNPSSGSSASSTTSSTSSLSSTSRTTSTTSSSSSKPSTSSTTTTSSSAGKEPLNKRKSVAATASMFETGAAFNGQNNNNTPGRKSGASSSSTTSYQRTGASAGPGGAR
ncbi:hypothetical protein CAOG_03110 [Capsaspora owczarzaki ATCC 30864]|uniref:RhoGEF domain containing protein n=1 Tax=Capsaspora owczarzaki (strain ATCC 30864) TaxID=595528 RepID=A0A0D2WNR7_CAPO3|nr:hypothetical protein CAOG_03110 [Capsaspora owczarzaki ATCC 30864]KJE92083.1 hypothetical protein CAOG_003110 [Capsaspora owczarzaki ATCC 30864]|eukprot:XP_004363949.1 hypothetical protein CAOG_03110 [Capsaspora owczarzaki ATCC 30864]